MVTDQHARHTVVVGWDFIALLDLEMRIRIQGYCFAQWGQIRYEVELEFFCISMMSNCQNILCSLHVSFPPKPTTKTVSTNFPEVFDQVLQVMVIVFSLKII